MNRDDTTRRVSVPVATRAPTGATNAYLVGDQSVLLVDPAARTDELDSLVADANVEHVAVTHTHPDHIGAVAEYADETGATVWARRWREERFERATGIEPDRTFVDGTKIETDAGPVTVFDTPGHAADHVAFGVGDRILCGDLAVAEGSVVVGAPEGDVRAYLTALRRLLAKNPVRLLPGHGPEIDDPQATLERLIRHRLDRETKVLAAIRDGATTIDDVLDAAYEKDLTGVEDLARATVVAHVEKLAHEGRVVLDGEQVRPL
ncbi:MBL fold metallo-hydrolase [Haloprofundus marisrubri]|uniref:MBL fold metallo-hydrolase n=1 Tax=Haloprofundus marisrubri TaxID=1514971 RepID=A0A0W1R8D4_9EURY|nr:MBL fold metallo-hydrolase [Haloprofundus marisrubri]KTG09697.1 MBL fold metallo-hydrolase [Haloprofundus marisrubri]